MSKSNKIVGLAATDHTITIENIFSSNATAMFFIQICEEKQYQEEGQTTDKWLTMIKKYDPVSATFSRPIPCYVRQSVSIEELQKGLLLLI